MKRRPIKGAGTPAEPRPKGAVYAQAVSTIEVLR